MPQFVLTSSNCIYEYGTENNFVCTSDDDRLYVLILLHMTNKLILLNIKYKIL